VKIWRVDPSDLSPASSPTKSTTEIEPQLTLRGHTGTITRLVVAGSKNLLYSSSLDSSIRVWAIPDAKLPTYVAYDSSRSRGELVGHTDGVWDIALMRDDALLASCGSDGTVKVWNLAGPGPGKLKSSWGYNGVGSDESTGQEVIGASSLEPIKSDLKKLAVAFRDGIVKIFDVDSGVQTTVLQAEGSTGANFRFPTAPVLMV
jgi:striatin 1/3/4